MKALKRIPTSLRIALIYFLIGMMWILFSDQILLFLLRDVERLTAFQTYKGLFYVFVTAIMVFLLVRSAILSENVSQERGETLSAIIQASPAAIVVADHRGKVLLWSPAAEGILGWRKEEVADDLKLILPPAHAQEILALLPQLEKGTKFSSLGMELITRDGQIINVDASLAPLYNADGGVNAFLAVFVDSTEKKAREEAMIFQAQQLREMAQQIARLQEEERRAIARELHDQIGQSLAAMGIHINILQNSGDRLSSSDARARFEDILQLLTEVSDDIRAIMENLRPSILDHYGLAAALKWYGARLQNRTGLQIEIDVSDLQPRLPEEVALALFRITQEALTNVLNHASASQASISLNRHDGRVQLQIQDNGKGFTNQEEPRKRQGWGLIHMRERAESVGARFTIHTAPENGTTITVDYPK